MAVIANRPFRQKALIRRLAASMAPGPPPVMMANPARESFSVVSTPTSYMGSLRFSRADPNTLTAGT